MTKSRELMVLTSLLVLTGGLRAQPKLVTGTIHRVEVKESSVTVTPNTNEPNPVRIIIKIDGDTKISLDGKDATIKSLSPKDKVSIFYDTRTSVATRMQVTRDGSNSVDEEKTKKDRDAPAGKVPQDKSAREKAEAEREARRLEDEKIEKAEREKLRLAKEAIEKEKERQIEAEAERYRLKQEKERLKKEKERADAEAALQAKLERERLEEERIKKEKDDKLEQERLERVRAEQEAKAIERAKQEKLAEEAAKAEANRQIMMSIAFVIMTLFVVFFYLKPLQRIGALKGKAKSEADDEKEDEPADGQKAVPADGQQSLKVRRVRKKKKGSGIDSV